VVVTGATGNVGTSLVASLSADPGAAGHTVAVARHAPADAATGPLVTFARCDLGAPGASRRLTSLFSGADAVVHLAWAINPPRGDEPMNRTNVLGSSNVLGAVAAAGVPHLVCASSVAAYGDAPRWNRVTEDRPLDGGIPGSAYSRHKVRLEAMLDRFETEHPAVTVARIRPCGIVAPGAGTRLASWLLSPLMPASGFGRPPLPVPTWPGMRFQLVHVEDVVDVVLRILAGRVGGAFNVASEPVLRPRDLAAAGASHVELPYPVLSTGAALSWRAGVQPLHPGWLRLADRAALVHTTAARDDLGWSPQVPAIDTLRQLVVAVRTSDRPHHTVRIGCPLRQSQG